MAGKRIKFIQVNLGGGKVATAELREHAVAQKVDVLLLQEPYHTQGKIRGFGGGMRTYQKQAEVAPGAGIVLVNPELTAIQLGWLGTSHCVVVWISEVDLYIVSSYCQHMDEIGGHIDELQRVLDALRGKSIVIGVDSNARNVRWGDRMVNERGERMEEFIERSRLWTVNDRHQMATFCNSRGGESWIDLTLSKGLGEWQVGEWRVEDGVTQSEHRVISFEYRAGGDRNVGRRAERFSIRRADWGRFRDQVERELGQNMRAEGREDLENKVREVAGVYIRAAEETIPRVRRGAKRMPWWTPELTAEKREVNVARRLYQGERDEVQKAQLRQEYLQRRNRYHWRIKRAKQEGWQRFVDRVGNEEPWGVIYKMSCRKMRKREVCTAMTRGGEQAVDWRQSMSLLLDEIIRRDDAREDDEWQERARWEAGNVIPENGNSGDFRMEEAERIIAELPRGKAPGPDGVVYEMLRATWPVAGDALLQLWNECLRQGVFPRDWKIGTLVLLLKGEEKDRSSPTSYRPISLLSVFGKVLEKLVLGRLEAGLEGEDRGNQYGFRKGRSTIDALEECGRVAAEAEEKYVVGLFLDVKGAFDTLWWPDILRVLRERNCPRDLYLLIRDYLTDRRVVVTEGEERVERGCEKGCPQGSILGPFFWNLVFDGNLEENRPWCRKIAYADDEVILVKGNSRPQLEQRAGEILDSTLQWCNRHKLHLSREKSVGLIMKGKFDRERRPRIRMGDGYIRMGDEVRHLGVYWGERMTVLPHLREMRAKIRKLGTDLRRVARAKWGLNHKSLAILNKGAVEPAALYGAEVWYGKLNAKSRDLLNSAQRPMLIAMARAYRTTSTDALSVIAGQIPLSHKAEEKCLVRKIRKREPVTIGGFEYDGSEELARRAREEARNHVIAKWQEAWERSGKGRTTYGFFPRVGDRLQMRWIEPTHWITQFLSGHGDFRARLRTLNLSETSECECGEQDTSEHLYVSCVDTERERGILQGQLVRQGIAWPPQQEALVVEDVFDNFRAFAETVLQAREEVRRNRNAE